MIGRSKRWWGYGGGGARAHQWWKCKDRRAALETLLATLHHTYAASRFTQTQVPENTHTQECSSLQVRGKANEWTDGSDDQNHTQGYDQTQKESKPEQGTLRNPLCWMKGARHKSTHNEAIRKAHDDQHVGRVTGISFCVMKTLNSEHTKNTKMYTLKRVNVMKWKLISIWKGNRSLQNQNNSLYSET